MAVQHRVSPQSFDDHPSLSASLEDFEQSPRSPVFGLPSQHSGFKSEESESEDEPKSDLSGEPWSPPAWRQQKSAGGWYQHQPYLQNKHLKSSVSASHSRDTSPKYESAQEDEGDITLAAEVPLPRGSVSPVKEGSPCLPSGKESISRGPSPYPHGGHASSPPFGETEDTVAVTENANNCGLLIPRFLQHNANLSHRYSFRSSCRGAAKD